MRARDIRGGSTPFTNPQRSVTRAARRASRRTPGTAVGAVAVALLAGCGGDGASPSPSTDAAAAEPPTPVSLANPWFEDVTAAWGVTFATANGDPDKHHLLESTGSGVAVGDYDDDGDLDLYFATSQTSSDWRADRRPRANALFRNDGGTFTDVAAEAGVDLRAWSIGPYFADYDGDGDLDLFVTTWGPNRLFENRGDGTFRDVTERAGVAGDPGAWSASASFGDLDGDGDLDLYVANYCEYDLDDPPLGGEKVQWKGLAVYAGPVGFVAQHDALFRNDGGGTFTEVTGEAGILAAGARYALGVTLSDFDDDGDLDAFVANDSQSNRLWRNDGGMRFTDIGILAGVATNEDAKEQAGMGTDAADYDGDGRIDLFVTNFSHDWNTLHRNLGGLQFADTTFLAGLRDAYLDLAWGTRFFDADHDGDLDLYVANGHIYPEVDAHPHLKTTYDQTDRMYRNEDGRFEDVAARSPGPLSEPRNTRGVAVADLDRDGALDLVLSHLDGDAVVLRNIVADGHWVSLRLRDDGPNRRAIGARVTLDAGGTTRVAEVQPFGSYLSSTEAAVHFGLGDTASIDTITVRWPDGTDETVEDVPVDAFVTVARGRGVVASRGGKQP